MRILVEKCTEYADRHGRTISELRGLEAWRREYNYVLGLRDRFRRLAHEEAEALEPQAGAVRTMPSDTVTFTGRRKEVDRLIAFATAPDRPTQAIGVYAIVSMAGIGKTTLAVHAAHVIADHFPDGQFFVPLHGHTPGRQPVSTLDAILSLLVMAEVPDQAIPAGLD